jgi:hypothetical protein
MYLFSSTAIFAASTYKPANGDKFTYKISHTFGKRYSATFIYNQSQKIPTFYYRWGSESLSWGTWLEPKINSKSIGVNLMDTAQLSKSNLLYLNHSLYKKIKSGKKIVLNLKGEALEFTKSKNTETDLPINEAGLKFKVLNATSKDKKWVISIIDNEFFPLIISIAGNISWQLQSIIPAPIFPITQNLLGMPFDSKQSDMFKSYIKETCEIIEFKYTDNFKKVIFNEYFCPIVGVRFSLKNDTLVSLQLVSENFKENGHDWKTYQGYVWGIYKLGDKKSSIETEYGKSVSTREGKNYYPFKKFYLIYNDNEDLELVEYE